ncbi:MAG TPA: primary-amine oxidase [Acidimicrobiia bacterium]|nr:primary-amine oxidase [Acidimicrobiia bacterium]
MTETLTPPTATADHPLAMLSAAEMKRGGDIVLGSGRLPESARFIHLVLHEPPKSEVLAWKPGDPIDRRVRALVVPGPELDLVEAVVSVTTGEILEWRVVEGMRPGLMFGETLTCILAVKEHPEWQAAMRRRGITDFDHVQLDPWPAGNFGLQLEAGRRISRVLSYLRESKTDNGYARPIEGVLVFFDLSKGEVITVEDHGLTPLPPERSSYLPEDVGAMRTDLRPIEITQPEGTSFTVEGNLVQWQRWSLRVGFDPYEGLTLHTIGYDDGGTVRPILYRASVSEMVVPYGHPSPMHNWKNAFDAGEWGLGRMTQSLTLGCDCLGVIHYFDARLSSEQGHPYTIENAICMHEEDYGILWKHVDLHGGTSEVRRSRRLVISSIATVGNYEYGFFWYFYLDGSIQLEVKLTGVISPMAVGDDHDAGLAGLVGPGVAGPNHQHLFNVRLDFDVDGVDNTVYECDAVTVDAGPDNPLGNAWRAVSTALASEQAAIRDTDAARSRVWKIVNPQRTNRLGQPVGYKLIPGSTPTLLARADSSIAARAGFARHNLWVTPYSPDERRAAGEYPNQHAGGDGLPRWTEADRALVDTDVVVWHTFGVTHVVRPEDWPVMPVEYAGFLMAPVGFFDRNPALDVPAGNGHCHSEGAVDALMES